MSDIYVRLDNEVANITRADTLSSGDVDTVYAHFTFSESWDSFPIKTVCVHTITLNEDKIGTNFVGINSEGVAVIPQKTLSQAGRLFIAVVGENTNGEVLTSTWVRLKILHGAGFEVEDDETDVLGRLVPAGGNAGDFLCKASDEDFDYTWGTPEFTLDTQMSDTSEKGVQNKVIKAYVDSMVVGQSAQVTIHTSGAGDMSPESATNYTKAQFNTMYNTDFDKIVETVSENGVVNIGYTNTSLSANNELTMVADVASYTSIIYESNVEIKTCVYDMKINYNTDTKHELYNFEMRFVYEDGVMTDSITTTLTKVFEPQAKLTAGDNITISNNVISATSDYEGKFAVPYWINTYDSESYVILSTDDRAKLYELVDSETYADRMIEFRVTYFDEEGQAIITEAECPVLDITAYTETIFGVDMVNISFKFSFFIDGKEYLIEATNFKIPVVSGSGYDTTSLPNITITEVQPKLTAGDNITITNNVISATGSASYTAGNGINITNDEISIDTSTVQEKLTAGTNVSISNGVISATDTVYTASDSISIDANNEISANYINPKYTYDGDTHVYTCDMSASDINDAVVAGKIVIPFVEYVSQSVAWSNANGAYAYRIENGPNDMKVLQIWVNMFGGTNNDCKYEFVIMHILGQNIITGTLNIQEYQRKLTAGSNITIDTSANTISATDTTYSAGNGLSLDNGSFSVDETVIQPKLTAGDNISINNNTIEAVLETYNVEYTYNAYTNTWTCEQSSSDIQAALEDGNKLLVFMKYINVNGILVWENTLGASSYILSAGPNNMYAIQVYLNMFGGNDNDTKYEFRFAHILGQDIITGALNIEEYQEKLTAGSNVSIDASTNTISATDTTYSAGNGLNLSNGEFSVDTTAIQSKLTAGTNITIDANNVISASGGSSPYIEGTGIDIDSSTNEISVDTTIIQEKLTEGSNISISSNTISADIVEPLVTFTMTPTGLTPAYSVSCDTSFSDITTLVNSDKFKAVLSITTSGSTTRYIPLTEYKYGGGTTYHFYFSYAEGDSLTTYVIAKDYTQQTDVYTYTIETGALTDTTYTAGTGISINNGVISVSYDNGDTEEY